MTKQEPKLKLFFEYLTALALLLDCHCVWSSLQGNGWMGEAIFAVLAVGVLGCIACTAASHEIEQRQLKFALGILVVTLVYVGIFVLVRPVNVRGLCRVAAGAILLMLWMFLCQKDKKVPSLLNRYSDLVLVVGVFSLFFWVFGSCLHLFGPTGTVVSEWAVPRREIPTYFGLYFEAASVNLFGHTFVRNSGIFAEAPMAALNYMLALLVELLLKEKTAWWRVVLLVLCLATTFSTTAGILLCFLVFAKFAIWALGRGKTAAKGGIIGMIFAGVLLLLVVAALVFHKWQSLSGHIRADDYRAGLLAFLQKPVFGSGFGVLSDVQAYMSANRAGNVALSSSFIAVIVQAGLYGLLPYAVLFLYNVVSAILNRQWNQMVYTVSLGFLFAALIFPYQYILLLNLSWFLKGAVTNHKLRKEGSAT